VAAPHRDARAAAAPPAAEPEVLPLVTGLQRSRLGTAAAVAGVLAVLLVAGGAPAPVRAPVVLIAALLLPGFPLVARLRVDLPTLVAIDVCTSLAIDAGLALLSVKTGLWHPLALGLVLACFGVGGTLVTLTALRHAEARHLQ
jgi:hypothetical protein